MRRPPQSRSSTTKHGALYRKAAWRRMSEQFRASPEGALCALCLVEGKVTPSELVDHIREHDGDPAKFWDPGNLRGLCWSHHSARHRAADGEYRPKGCTADGMPKDPSHHWRET